MQVILFLALLSILVAGGFLFAFFWAVRSGQYEDEVTPAIRILFDEPTSAKQDQHDDDDNNV
ncbi:MAG: cbb3-type cytochrome oxidase assembly protein CcoS [Bacteroidota bacterium]